MTISIVVVLTWALAYLIAWRLNRRAKLTDPVWETMNALYIAKRVVVYDPNGKRVAVGYRSEDSTGKETVIVKLG